MTTQPQEPTATQQPIPVQAPPPYQQATYEPSAAVPPYTPPQPAPRRRRRRAPLIIGTVLAVAVAAGGSALIVYATSRTTPSTVTPSASPSPTVFALIGSLTLEDDDFARSTPGASCTGSGGYGDIGASAPVVVTDASGTIVAIGRLDPGRVTNTVPRACVFGFAVQNIPVGHGFYGVEISHRGAVRYTEADLSAGAAHLTLG